MKILVWAHLFLPDIGGIETLLGELLPELKKRGHDVILVTSHGRFSMPDESVFDGIPVYRFHFRKAMTNNALPQIIAIRHSISELKKRFQPDIVHLHFPDPSFYFHLNTQSAHPAPMLVSLHSWHDSLFSKQQKNSLFERGLSEANWVTAVSDTVLKKGQNFFPGIMKKSSVVYNGLAPLDIPPSLLSFDRPNIFCAGRLIPVKAFHHAIDAFVTVCESFTDATLTIAGDGILREKLERQANNSGVSENIHFLGKVKPEEISPCMAAATIVLISSDSEGFPMTLLEAGRMGRPVVTTDVGGISEAILHDETGLLVKPGNSMALAKALIDLLSNPEKCWEMGDAARTRIAEKFSLNACVNSYEQLYIKLAG